MTWDALIKLAKTLTDDVELGTSYRTPALKYEDRMLVRLWEDGKTVVVHVESVDEQQFLLRTQPDVFHLTSHYEGYPLVLARLVSLTSKTARTLLGEELARRGWHPDAVTSRASKAATKKARSKRARTTVRAAKTKRPKATKTKRTASKKRD